MASQARKMMLGTEHRLDYLILKERDGTGLAIKPRTAVHPQHGLTYMVTIRAARLASAPLKVKNAEIDWSEVWGEFQWDKNDESRASSGLVFFPGFMPTRADKAKELLNEHLGQIVDWIGEKVDGVIDRDDAIAFLGETFAPWLDDAIKAFADEPMDNVPQGVQYVRGLVPKKASPPNPNKSGGVTGQPSKKKGFVPSVVAGTDFDGDDPEDETDDGDHVEE